MTVTTLGLTASATLASELMVALLTLAGDEVVVSPSSLGHGVGAGRAGGDPEP
jgi:hypothetical protein